MRQKIVAGNWKMFGSNSENALLCQGILAGVESLNQVKLVVFPPSVYLLQVQQLLLGSPVGLGAQNVSEQPKGPFTGEIATSMLRDVGCEYVLAGHSERRQHYGETDEIVAQKFMAAAIADLKPILCVGETLADRKANNTEQVIASQISALLDLENGANSLYNGAIAYEPVWAIGTGQTATPEQAQVVHASIRAQIAKHDPLLAEQLMILYGGSVKRANAAELFAMPDIDGGLIGGASLDAEHFLDIAKLCNNC